MKIGTKKKKVLLEYKEMQHCTALFKILENQESGKTRPPSYVEVKFYTMFYLKTGKEHASFF